MIEPDSTRGAEAARGAPAQGPSPARPRAALALATAVAGTLVPPLVAIASGHTLAWRDTARLIGSWRPAIEADLRAFHLPLWGPYESLGLPLLAQLMHGILHPVSLVTAFLAPGASMDLPIVLHLALAAAGAWVLARVLGASPWAAAVAGLAYGLSGYVLGMTCVLTYLAGAAAAPWAAAGLTAAAAGRRAGVAAGGAGAAVLALAGDPQWLVVGTALGLLLAAHEERASGVARALLGAAIGALAAGVQLVPALAFLPGTTRVLAFSSYERALWALPPWRLPELVLPGLFNGVPGSGTSHVFVALGGDVGRHTTSFVPSVFVGLVVLVLAVTGVRAARAGRWLAAAAGVFLWIALGVNAGADQLLRWMPVWGAFRYSEKLVGPATLCLAVLAALGADRLASGPAPRLRRALAGLGAALAILLVLASPAGSGLVEALAPGPAAPELRHRLAVGALHLALAGGLLAAVLVAARRRPGAALLLAVGAVFLESAAAAPFALHAGARGAVERDPLRSLRREGEVLRVATPVPTPPVLPAPGHEALDAADRLAALQSRLGVAPYPASAGIDQLDCYSGFSPAAFDTFSAAIERDLGLRFWEAWRRLGLTHVVVPRALLREQVQSASASIEGGAKVLQDDAWGFTAWSVPGRPYASFASGVVPVPDADASYGAFVAQVSHGSPEVVLEGPPPRGTSPGRVLAVERRSGEVRIVAEAEGDALLIVNDLFWPGWHARVDGAEVPIQRADVLVRAVPFPPGRHAVELRYRPPEVAWGLAATALGIAILCALAVRAARGRPPSPS